MRVKSILWLFIGFFLFVPHYVFNQDEVQNKRARIYVETGQSRITNSAISPDGKVIATSGEEIKLWDALSGKELATIDFYPNIDAKDKKKFLSVIFSRDGKYLIASSYNRDVRFWDIENFREKKFPNLETEEETRIIEVPSDLEANTFPFCNSLALSRDNKILACGAVNQIFFWNAENGVLLKRLFSPYNDIGINSLVFAEDDKGFAYSNTQKTYVFNDLQKILNLEYSREKNHITWEQLEQNKDFQTFENGNFLPKALEFNSQKELVGVGIDKEKDENYGANDVYLYNYNQQKIVQKLPLKNSENWSSISFSLSNEILVNGYLTQIVFDLKKEKEISQLKTSVNDDSENNFEPITDIEFVSNEKLTEDFNKILKEKGAKDEELLTANPDAGDLLVATTMTGGWYGVDLKKGTIQFFKNASYRPPDVPTLMAVNTKNAQAENKTYKVILSNNESIRIYEKSTGNDLISIYFSSQNKWILTSPEGRFDTNFPIDEANNVHWIFDNQWKNPVPLEIFMRQYYEPNLLEKILNGVNLKPIPSIAEINRLQPLVKIKEIKLNKLKKGFADIWVEVTDVKNENTSSGVYDLRLFRDGQLVKTSTTNENLTKYIEELKTQTNSEEKLWEETTNLINNSKIEFNQNGKAIYKFENVRIPQNTKTTFSTYAFNLNRIKSFNDSKEVEIDFTGNSDENIVPTFDIPLLNSKKEYIPPKGKVYLITIGVNTSENPSWNLSYAANDAKSIQNILTPLLKKNKNITQVINVPLISEKVAGKLSNKATKPIIQGVFSLLAGKKQEVSNEVFLQIPSAKLINPIMPEDTLIISFAGHGYADKNGVFYLIPSDIGKETDSMQNVLSKSISSDELSLWFQDVTAHEMLFIIDACHSATAIQGNEFKPGPMGSRGLGQLAYDKGMRILAATQADNVALESSKLKQGLLTYTLIKEAIQEGKADIEQPEFEISIDEWWNYAVNRVPEIYEEIRSGKRSITINGKVPDTKMRVEVFGEQDSSNPNVNVQKPSFFNFKKNSQTYSFINTPITVKSTTASEKGIFLENEREEKCNELTRHFQIISIPKPRYTDEARDNFLQGTVVLRVTFFSNGTIGNISVVKGLGYGLSEKAIAAAKNIRFNPQMKCGQPMSVTKSVEFTFTLY